MGVFLSGRALLLVLVALAAAPSAAGAGDGDWLSYGMDLANSRSQPHPAGVGDATARRLVERWSIRHAGPVDGIYASATATPAVAGGKAYYTDWTGRLTATSLRTGRVLWSTKVSIGTDALRAGVWSSPTVAGDSVYVAALEGRVVAVSARTGRVRWATELDRRE